MIASSVALSRALKQTERRRLFRNHTERALALEHVPQGRKECGGSVRCTNTDTSSQRARDLQQKVNFSSSETVYRRDPLAKGHASGVDEANKNRDVIRQVSILVQ